MSERVAIIDVSKHYGRGPAALHALDRVSFTIRPKEFVALLGPSGCGKSTLLMLTAGLIQPSGGEVRIDGQRVTRPRIDVGIVFQTDVLLDWRRVLGNVMLQIEARGMDAKQGERRARELLQLVGLEGFEARYPFELSGGMRQRVSIVRALVHDPALLLMDEPFGALDALTRDQLNSELQMLCLQTQKTVLFVTHSIEEAVFLADRVVVMTPRPGTVARAFEVAMPRPRSFSMRASPEFTRLVAEIRALFEQYGVLREATRAPEGISSDQLAGN